MQRWTGWMWVAVLALAFFAAPFDAVSDDRPTMRPFDFKDLSIKSDGDDDDDDHPGRPFQLAFTSRADSDAVQPDGTSRLVGYAESLQAPMPGVVLGPFEQHNGALCQGAALPECPVPGACLPICDTVHTPHGSLTYQAFALALQPSLSGPFPVSGIYGEIVGGTRSYRNATGTVSVDGQINFCTTPGDGQGCALSDLVPPGLGLRYDLVFVLRGHRGR